MNLLKSKTGGQRDVTLVYGSDHFPCTALLFLYPIASVYGGLIMALIDVEVKDNIGLYVSTIPPKETR